MLKSFMIFAVAYLVLMFTLGDVQRKENLAPISQKSEYKGYMLAVKDENIAMQLWVYDSCKRDGQFIMDNGTVIKCEVVK